MKRRVRRLFLKRFRGPTDPGRKRHVLAWLFAGIAMLIASLLVELPVALALLLTFAASYVVGWSADATNRSVLRQSEAQLRREMVSSASGGREYFLKEESTSTIVGGGFWPGAVKLPRYGRRRNLISVVMPVFNAEDFVKEAVESALKSQGVAIELVIVDDGSSDATPEIVRELAAGDGRIRFIQSHRNHGPYFCRNIGLLAARGRYVAFHDADDRHDSKRLRAQLEDLQRGRAAVSICHAARWSQDWSKTLSEPRFASVTMMFDRSLIAEVGFFDSVRWGGDSEFIARVKALKGRQAISIIEAELYSLRWHNNCLTAHDDHRAYVERNGRLDLNLSPARKAYEAAFTSWHDSTDRPHIDFPLRERPFAIPKEQSSSFFQGLAFVGGMATHPPREDVARTAVASVADSLDSIEVYFNSYESPPEWAYKFANLNPKMGEDLQDVGKFAALEGKSGLWFTFDDDISYPPDYVRSMAIALALSPSKTVVGVHGIRFSNTRNFLEGRKVHHFREAHTGSSVDALGTGTTAFDSREFAPTLDDFPRQGFCDLYFAGFVHQKGGNLFCVPRSNGWLIELIKPGPEALWTQTVSQWALAQEVFEESGLGRLNDRSIGVNGSGVRVKKV